MMLAQAVAVGSGHLKRSQSESILRGWRQSVQRGQRGLRRERRMSVEQRVAAVAALGIPVTEVPSKRGKPGDGDGDGDRS